MQIVFSCPEFLEADQALDGDAAEEELQLRSDFSHAAELAAWLREQADQLERFVRPLRSVPATSKRRRTSATCSVCGRKHRAGSAIALRHSKLAKEAVA